MHSEFPVVTIISCYLLGADVKAHVNGMDFLNNYFSANSKETCIVPCFCVQFIYRMMIVCILKTFFVINIENKH
uniref:Uncharacterized protein n=1 Tax=Anguilla anguilla TaxID=7936 RepID=A0A0E9X2F3_ANGAN